MAPKTFIKFVDACESGVSYIKNSIDFEKFQKTKAGFKDVFFLFSSSSNEASYADTHLSYLTESIINSIVEHKADSIKYTNILNYTSDFFENLDFQRPYVVQQGNINSVFCSTKGNIRAKLMPFLRTKQPMVAVGEKQPEQKSRLDLIKEESGVYCSKEEAESAIMRSGEMLADLQLSGDLGSIYSLRQEEIAINAIPSSVDIGEYLNKVGGKGYFAKPIYRDSEPDKYSRVLNPIGMSPPKVVAGFEHTTKISVPCFKLIAVSTYAAINEMRCFVAPIISRTSITFAHRVYQYERIDWDRIKISSFTEWRFEEAAIKSDEQIKAALRRIGNSINEHLEAYISARFGSNN